VLSFAVTFLALPVAAASADSSGWSGTVTRSMSYDFGDHSPNFNKVVETYTATFDGSAGPAGRTNGKTTARRVEDTYSDQGVCGGTGTHTDASAMLVHDELEVSLDPGHTGAYTLGTIGVQVKGPSTATGTCPNSTTAYYIINVGNDIDEDEGAGSTTDPNHIQDSTHTTMNGAAVTTTWNLSKTTEPACHDGLDNDGDHKTDYPFDPGCSSQTDTTEEDPPSDKPACSDGHNNDFDGLSDGDDPGCTGPADTSELGTNQCDNGVDDDGDANFDWPADHDCADVSDTSELASCPGGFPAPRGVKPVRTVHANGGFDITNWFGNQDFAKRMNWNGSVTWCTNGYSLKVLNGEGMMTLDVAAGRLATFYQAFYEGANTFFGSLEGNLKWKPATPTWTQQKIEAVPSQPGTFPASWLIKVKTGELQSCFDPISLLWLGAKGKVVKRTIGNRKAWKKLSNAAQERLLRALQKRYARELAYPARQLKRLASKLRKRYTSQGPSAAEVKRYGSLTFKTGNGTSTKTVKLVAGEPLSRVDAERLAKLESERLRKKDVADARRALDVVKDGLKTLLDKRIPRIFCSHLWTPKFVVRTTMGADAPLTRELRSDKFSPFNSWAHEAG
jgi:hypothetical protein